MTWKALAVELIRIFWNKGLYRQSKILKQIHFEWFDYWVQWKTSKTMEEVDRQIEKIFLESEIDPPVFSEQEDGETPIGGRMELRVPWLDEDTD